MDSHRQSRRRAEETDMSLQIRNHKTNETVTLSSDVRTVHPDWVHEQCETAGEVELQYMLDQIHEDDYASAGEDYCGISLVPQ